jgi:hypothetical protein
MKSISAINKIQKFFFIAGAVFLFSTFGNAQSLRSVVAAPTNFQKIETTAQVPLCRKSLKACGEEALLALDLAGFGGPDSIKYTTQTFVFNKGVSVYLLTITGLEDDSVSGERLRVAFIKTSRGYRFVQAGRQFKCRRGKNAGKWTKELCP